MANCNCNVNNFLSSTTTFISDSTFYSPDYSKTRFGEFSDTSSGSVESPPVEHPNSLPPSLASFLDKQSEIITATGFIFYFSHLNDEGPAVKIKCILILIR